VSAVYFIDIIACDIPVMNHSERCLELGFAACETQTYIKEGINS
jgi:hypothetical protein